ERVQLERYDWCARLNIERRPSNCPGCDDRLNRQSGLLSQNGNQSTAPGYACDELVSCYQWKEYKANNSRSNWSVRFGVPLRVYNQDVFKKDEYVGRVLMPLKNLVLNQLQEFSVQLTNEDSNEATPVGELTFSLILGEKPELEVAADRRQFLLKQLKIDRQNAYQYPTMTTKRPSPDISPNGCDVSSWCENAARFYSDSTQEMNSIYAQHIYSAIDDDDMEGDDWLDENEFYFRQPSWPACFYDGTKLEVYTGRLPNKLQPLPFSQISRLPKVITDVNWEQMYTRSKLVVSLIGAQRLEAKQKSETIFAGSVHRSHSQHARSAKKHASGHEEKSKSDVAEPPSPMALLSVGRTTFRSAVIKNTRHPSWHQEFEFRLRTGDKKILQVEIRDMSTNPYTTLVRAYLDFAKLMPDWTDCFTLKNVIEGHDGQVVLLATLTGFSKPLDPTSVSPLPANYRTSQVSVRPPEPVEDGVIIPPTQTPVSSELLDLVAENYSLRNTIKDRFDVGWLHVFGKSGVWYSRIGLMDAFEVSYMMIVIIKHINISVDTDASLPYNHKNRASRICSVLSAQFYATERLSYHLSNFFRLTQYRKMTSWIMMNVAKCGSSKFPFFFQIHTRTYVSTRYIIFTPFLYDVFAVIGARQIKAADSNGKSDPYCTLRLVNRVAYTSTIYKTLDPTWNQGFVFPIGDIYSVLEVTIWDEDKEKADFLGRIQLPLNQITSRRKRWYTLKDKTMKKLAKGSICLEVNVEHNPRRTPSSWIHTPRKTNTPIFVETLCITLSFECLCQKPAAKLRGRKICIASSSDLWEVVLEPQLVVFASFRRITRIVIPNRVRRTIHYQNIRLCRTFPPIIATCKKSVGLPGNMDFSGEFYTRDLKHTILHDRLLTRFADQLSFSLASMAIFMYVTYVVTGIPALRICPVVLQQKGFFRRSIQKQIEYKCLRDGKCLVIRLNRNRCQYCRFRKCIAVGMSKESVRYGRMPRRTRSSEPTPTPEINLPGHRTPGGTLSIGPESSGQPSAFGPPTGSSNTSSLSTRTGVCSRPPLDQLGLYDIILTVNQAYQNFSSYTEDKVKQMRCRPISLPSVVCMMFTFSESFNALRLNDAEIALCCAAVLTKPDRYGLSEPNKVALMQDRNIAALRMQLERNRPAEPVIMSQVRNSLIQLASLGETLQLSIRWYRENWYRTRLAPLYAETYDIPHEETTTASTPPAMSASNATAQVAGVVSSNNSYDAGSVYQPAIGFNGGMEISSYGTNGIVIPPVMQHHYPGSGITPTDGPNPTYFSAPTSNSRIPSGTVQHYPSGTSTPLMPARSQNRPPSVGSPKDPYSASNLACSPSSHSTIPRSNANQAGFHTSSAAVHAPSNVNSFPRTLHCSTSENGPLNSRPQDSNSHSLDRQSQLPILQKAPGYCSENTDESPAHTPLVLHQLNSEACSPTITTTCSFDPAVASDPRQSCSSGPSTPRQPASAPTTPNVEDSFIVWGSQNGLVGVPNHDAAMDFPNSPQPDSNYRAPENSSTVKPFDDMRSVPLVAAKKEAANYFDDESIE
ncbi:ecdysone-induced protein 78C, partial [Clonorchis sinensis]